MQLQKGDKVYFPDGDKFFYGEWTGMRAQPGYPDGYGNTMYGDSLYLIHCHDCGRLHPVPKEELYPLPDIGEDKPNYMKDLEVTWFSWDQNWGRSEQPTSDTGYTSIGIHLKSFKRAINREKYQRRRAMALATIGLCSAIVAGFSFLDGRLILGSIATLAYIACFCLSYLVERRD